MKLGKASFEMLSDDEKHILKLFIWCGCGCHKDLNTVRGGNAAMMVWWKEHNVSGPVLLANRDNTAVLSDCDTTSDTAIFPVPHSGELIPSSPSPLHESPLPSQTDRVFQQLP